MQTLRMCAYGMFMACTSILVLAPIPASAYQIRVIWQVNPSTPIVITEPEIRTLWYDELRGSARVYEIDSSQPFRFVAQLAVPDRESPRTDYVVEIIEVSGGAATPDRVFASFDGSGVAWERTYNWVDGRWYLTGLSIDEQVPPGRYRVTVENGVNQGKYLFTVGSTIDPAQMYEPLRTLGTLPAVSVYHGDTLLSVARSPFAWVPILVLLGIALLLGRTYRYLTREEYV